MHTRLAQSCGYRIASSAGTARTRALPFFDGSETRKFSEGEGETVWVFLAEIFLEGSDSFCCDLLLFGLKSGTDALFVIAGDGIFLKFFMVIEVG